MLKKSNNRTKALPKLSKRLIPPIIFLITITKIYFTGFDFSYQIQFPYKYPVHAGTAEWTALETTEARRLASNIDADILSNMTTMALVRTVINYPLFMDIYAFDTPASGINSVSERYAGLPELFSRTDAAVCLKKFMTEKSVLRFISPKALLQHTSAKTLLNYLNEYPNRKKEPMQQCVPYSPILPMLQSHC